MNNNKITVEELMKELNIKFSNGKKQRLSYLLDRVYRTGITTKQSIVETIRKILLSDPNLTALDDIYIYKYGNNIKIDYKYTFWPKKYIESGIFTNVDAYLVREGDKIQVSIKNGETKIEHEFNPFSGGKIIGAYARGIKPDGSVVIALATKEELDNAAKAAKIQKRNNFTAWDNWFDELAKKVPIKRLVKLVPTPIELQNALDVDNEQYDMKELEKLNNEKFQAVEELNEQLEDNKISLLDAVSKLGIKFDVKAGYIKVDKKYLDEENASLLGLQSHKKVPDGWIGKAMTKIDKGLVDQVVVIMPEDEKPENTEEHKNGKEGEDNE